MTVRATDNIYGAGQSSLAAAPGGAGTIPSGYAFTPQPYLVVTFPSIGWSDPRGVALNGDDSMFAGPDGKTWAGNSESTNVTSVNSISGAMAAGRSLFVIGVFLTNAVPSGGAPAAVDYTNANLQVDFHPQVGQTFFIGDGFTAGGVQQQFWAPEGATRLYLGFADGWHFVGAPSWYGDNRGSFTYTINVDPNPPGVPEPGTFALAGLAFAGPGLAASQARLSTTLKGRRCGKQPPCPS